MIKLAQIMKDRTYPESGSVLYDSIAPLLTRDEKVALDLDGVIALPSMFLNASIGSILHGCKGIHDCKSSATCR